MFALWIFCISSAFAQDKPAPRQEAQKKAAVSQEQHKKQAKKPIPATRLNYKPRNPKYDGCRSDPRFEHC